MKLVEVSNYHVTLCLCAYTSCHVYYPHFIKISLHIITKPSHYCIDYCIDNLLYRCTHVVSKMYLMKVN